jgi:hypothetical protein
MTVSPSSSRKLLSTANLYFHYAPFNSNSNSLQSITQLKFPAALTITVIWLSEHPRPHLPPTVSLGRLSKIKFKRSLLISIEIKSTLPPYFPCCSWRDSGFSPSYLIPPKHLIWVEAVDAIFISIFLHFCFSSIKNSSSNENECWKHQPRVFIFHYISSRSLEWTEMPFAKMQCFIYVSWDWKAEMEFNNEPLEAPPKPIRAMLIFLLIILHLLRAFYDKRYAESTHGNRVEYIFSAASVPSASTRISGLFERHAIFPCTYLKHMHLDCSRRCVLTTMSSSSSLSSFWKSGGKN